MEQWWPNIIPLSVTIQGYCLDFHFLECVLIDAFPDCVARSHRALYQRLLIGGLTCWEHTLRFVFSVEIAFGVASAFAHKFTLL